MLNYSELNEQFAFWNVSPVAADCFFILYFIETGIFRAKRLEPNQKEVK
jgi:hypothetical protein